MEVWIAIITSIVGPGLVIFLKWLFGERNINKKAIQNAAKQSILQLILEDKMSVMEGKIPENRQNILQEYQDYSAAGGNHYIKKKVDDYEAWYRDIEKRMIKKEN